MKTRLLALFAFVVLFTETEASAQKVVSGYFQCPYCGQGIGQFDDQSEGYAALQRHISTCSKAPSRPQPSTGAVPNQQFLNQSAFDAGYAFGAWLTSPSPPSPEEQRAIQLNDQAVDLINREGADLQFILGMLQEAQRLSPRDRMIQRNIHDCRARLAGQNGNWQLAVREWEEALKLMDGRDEKIQNRLKNARAQLEAQIRDGIASRLEGTLKLSGDSTRPTFDGDRGDYVNKNVNIQDNPLGLKFGGSSEANLQPKGTAFFGQGSGTGSQSFAAPTGDTEIVDLRGARTDIVDPVVVRGETERLQSQSGAGIAQGSVDKLPSPNLLPQRPVGALRDAPNDNRTSDNPLGLKLGNDTQPHLRDRLPGIYLNDTSGKGNDTPYGIKGLPGVYLNGPRSGENATSPSDTKLRPMNTTEHPSSGTSESPQNQNSSRTPSNTTEQQGDTPLPTTLGLLEKQSDASQTAATAQTLDDASAKARAGFDTALPSGNSSPFKLHSSNQLLEGLDGTQAGDNLAAQRSIESPERANSDQVPSRHSSSAPSQASVFSGDPRSPVSKPAIVSSDETLKDAVAAVPPTLQAGGLVFASQNDGRNQQRTEPKKAETTKDKNAPCGSLSDTPIPAFVFVSQEQASRVKHYATNRCVTVSITGSRAETWDSYVRRKSLPDGHSKLPKWRGEGENRDSDLIENYAKTGKLGAGFDVDIGPDTILTDDLKRELLEIFRASKVDQYEIENGGGMITFRADGRVIWIKPRWHIEIDQNGN